MRALGIDIGTTTISMVVFDVETKQAEQTITVRNDSFLDTEEAWRREQDPEKILSLILERIDSSSIQAIGLTGQMHGILYVNQDGNSVSPLYTWQDKRGEIPISGEKTACDLAKEAGALAASGYGLITHLYNCKAGLVPEKAAGICTIMDYLGMKLTGRKKPYMHSSNAASLGFFDVEKGCFQTEILEKLGISQSILPMVTEDLVLLGDYKGILTGIAIGDNQASFLGSVKDAKNSILVNMGTGGQISILTDRWLRIPRMETRPFVKGSYLLAGASLCGGRAYAILAHFFELTARAFGCTGADPYAVMDSFLSTETGEEKTGGSEGMIVDTAFSGTREEPERRGSIRLLSEENFRPDTLTYGVLEGMAQELLELYENAAGQLSLTKTRMIASGNGLRKNLHLQKIMSEKFQMKLQMAEHKEEAAAGAVFAVMIAMGKWSLSEVIG